MVSHAKQTRSELFPVGNDPLRANLARVAGLLSQMYLRARALSVT
jgi:hypothetical protein